MIATPQEIQTLESYFTTTTLPKELNLNPAVHIINLTAYVKQVIDNLKRTDISEASLRPRYEDLLHIKELIEATEP